MDYRLLQFNAFADERGQLVALESNRGIPFEIKRVFYMYDTKDDTERGKHANKFSKQVIVCLSGSCLVTIDDGKAQKHIHLNKREEGLFIGPGLWKEIRNFSKDCVVMVLTDTYYDASEYIRNYEEFLRRLRQGEGVGV